MEIDDCHYALVRIHHMLLADCPDLNLGQVLQLERVTSGTITINDDPLFVVPRQYCTHLIFISNWLIAQVQDLWRQFLISFDSELPSSGVFTFIAKSVIYCVNHLSPSHNNQIQDTHGYGAVEDLSLYSAGKAVRRTFDPSQLVVSVTQILQYSLRILCLVIPRFVYREILYIFRNGITSKDSESVLINRALVVSGALIEMWQIITMVAHAPLCVLETLFDRRQFGRNVLNSVSVQGRKSVAWSNVKQVEASKSLCFTSIGYSLRYLLEELVAKEHEAKRPNKCAVAVRTTSWDTILGQREG